MSNFIGPVLPPHLLNRISSDDNTDHVENNEQIPLNSQEDIQIGPSLPPHLLQVAPEDDEHGDSDRGPSQYLERQIVKSKVSLDTSESIGPQLPSHTERNVTVNQVNEVGPTLPLQGTKFNNAKNTSRSTIGPTLPPKLRTKFSSKSSKISDSSDEEPGVIGPALPPHLKSEDDDDNSQVDSIDVSVIGPRLPPFLTTKNDKRLQSSALDNTSDDLSIIGPSLATRLKSKLEDELPTVVEDETVNESSKPVIGPSLPSHLKLNAASDPEDTEDMYGPALPPGFRPKTVVREEVTEDQVTESDDDDDDDDIGPLPEGSQSSNRTQHQLELRAQRLREAMAAGETSANEVPTQRESWMLELPAERAPELGLRPRQFRVREGPEAGDRSVWTDTPAERERKKKAPKSKSPDRGALDRQAVQERDKIMEQLAEEHGNKRGSRSLVDLHEEKLQAKRKKAEADGEIQERRPFSREVDLQVNRFDEAQKRSILKKAQHLNDRFSSGHSKFL